MPFAQRVNRHFLAQFFGKTTGLITLEASLYVGLSRTVPNKQGGNITPPTSTDYAQLELTRVGSAFTDPTDADPSVLDNTGLLEFALSTEEWDSSAFFTHVTVHMNAAATPSVVAGDFVGFSPLSPTQNITGAGQRIQVPIGDLDFTQT